jgi:hypothetical protein
MKRLPENRPEGALPGVDILFLVRERAEQRYRDEGFRQRGYLKERSTPDFLRFASHRFSRRTPCAATEPGAETSKKRGIAKHPPSQWPMLVNSLILCRFPPYFKRHSRLPPVSQRVGSRPPMGVALVEGWLQAVLQCCSATLKDDRGVSASTQRRENPTHQVVL